MTEDPNARQLAKSSGEIESLLEALLALARAESSLLEPLPLRSTLESLLLDRAATLERRDFDLKLQVPDDVRVDANAQVCKLLLGNLLDNALHYASPPVLNICMEGGSLLLENPYNDAEHTPHVASLGHGLSLVERLAQAQGWQFTSETSAGKFLVRLSW